MEKIIDKHRLNEYIEKYDISDIFSIDMKAHMELFLFNKNEHICKADESLGYLYFFVDGRAKVYTTLSNGKSLLLCFYEPFKVIGDVEFINLHSVISNVQVIEKSYCIGIALENIRKLAFNDAKFLRYMCSCLGEKLIRLGNYSSINLLYTLENRLASYILATTLGNQSSDGSNIIFESNLSEVSELLGTSYRHLLRTLNLLSNKGAIRKNGNCYEILNLSILEKLAGDLYE